MQPAISDDLLAQVKHFAKTHNINVDLSADGLAKWRDEQKKKVAQQATTFYVQSKRDFYHNNSLVVDKNVFANRFKNIESTCQPIKDNAKRVKKLSEDYQNGERYNVIMQGKPGTGKTMLASALLNDLSNNSNPPLACLFIDAVMLRECALAMNERYGSLSVKKQQDHYLQLQEDVKQADVVVLDDLGSESSMNDKSINEANETVQRALFQLTTALTNKALIVTTNYTLKQLCMMYNSKIISRIITQNKEHIIKFEGIPDYRVINN